MNLNQRASGVVLHITSLPGPHGIGDFGPAATHFVDWLQAAVCALLARASSSSSSMAVVADGAGSGADASTEVQR